VPRASSWLGGRTNVQHALTVRGALQTFGLAAGEIVHALQKSALPSAGAPSHEAPGPVPPSVGVSVVLLEHATTAKRHVADKEEKRWRQAREDDGFMGVVIVQGSAVPQRSRRAARNYLESSAMFHG